MNWIIFSLIPPAFWALDNFIEKYFLNKFNIKKGGGISLMLSTSLFGVAVPIFIFALKGSSVPVSVISAILFIIAGSVAVIGTIFYIRALSADDVTTVIPLFQTMPIFGYILGYFLLGERLTHNQIMAGLLILAGSIILTLELREKRPSLKWGIFFLVLTSSFIGALSNIIFKLAALKENYWGGMFWLYIGVIITSIILLKAVKPWRSEFVGTWQQNWRQVVGLNFIIEALSVVAYFIFSFALILAPVALVAVLSNGFQPIFVLIFAVFFSFFMPRFSKEKFSKGQLIQKTISILIIFIGTYLLNR